MLYWRFHFKKENPSQLLICSMEVNIYIGFWTLKPKCTQYGLCGRAIFKNSRVRAGQSRGTEALAFSVLPLPIALTRATLDGFLESPVTKAQKTTSALWNRPWCASKHQHFSSTLPSVNNKRDLVAARSWAAPRQLFHLVQLLRDREQPAGEVFRLLPETVVVLHNRAQRAVLRSLCLGAGYCYQ